MGDARESNGHDIYDLVIAAYLLNYAHDADELAALCQGVRSRLASGGRFVSVNCSPLCDFTSAPSYYQYGFEARCPGQQANGAPIRWTFHLNCGSIEIENYFLDRETHERVLHDAGFHEVRWHAARLAPAAVPPEPGFWSPLFERPPLVFIECFK